MHKPFKKIASTSTKKIKMPEQPPTPPKKSEDELFFLAMNGVAPLSGKGREIILPPAEYAAGKKLHRKRPRFATLLEKSIEFDLESTHAYIQGYVKGLDQKIFRKLKAGGFRVEAHLDLHGHTSDDAKCALLDFMREHYLQSSRCVLIIPGRGKNSPLGMSILRQGLQLWLTQDPIKHVVLAFCTAQPRHGGAGALYVLLRNHKKGKGKIMWDTMIFNEEG